MKAPCHPVLRKTYHVPLEENPGLLPGVCPLPHPPAHTGSLWFTQRLSPGNHTASHTVPRETDTQGRSLACPRSPASEGWHWSLGLGDVHSTAFSVLSYRVSKGMALDMAPGMVPGCLCRQAQGTQFTQGFQLLISFNFPGPESSERCP